MLLERIAGKRLARERHELLCHRPRRRKELARGEAGERGDRPDREEGDEPDACQQRELTRRQRGATPHRGCHGIARASSHDSTLVISAPAIATLIMPTTIIAGKRSSPA